MKKTISGQALIHALRLKDDGDIITPISKHEVHCYGLKVFKPGHKSVRRLKKTHAPGFFGFRVWASCWLLIDYLQQHGIPVGTSVLDIGCGWGLAGIYCAKQFNANVTSIDIDSSVFPYLHLHSDANSVALVTQHSDFNNLSVEQLLKSDLIIGTDICFWEETVDVLIELIDRGLQFGVRQFLFADPGRTSFETLAEKCEKRFGARHFFWRSKRPYLIEGKILVIGSCFH